jgi:hypothetical protein
MGEKADEPKGTHHASRPADETTQRSGTSDSLQSVRALHSGRAV